jgi:hypothetical protein
MPALCVGTFGLYQYTALHNYRNNGNWLLYAVAGAITIAMVPFSWVFMLPTNNVLFGPDKSATEPGSGNPDFRAGHYCEMVMVAYPPLFFFRLPVSSLAPRTILREFGI